MRFRSISLDDMILVKRVAQDLLYKKNGERIITIQPLPGAFNSLVFRILTERGAQYLLKKYLIHKDDPRDRFSTEFFGLSFLWNNGIRAIPEPICSDRKQRIGVYRFIDGKKLKPEEISINDVYLAGDFLGRLHSLTKIEGAESQPIASEACFSLKAYIKCIEGRLRRLKTLPIKNNAFESLHLYLEGDFLPFFAETKEFVRQRATRHRIDINKELQKDEKTLSPSDFGFHNAIKCKDGSLVFVDFEYYGWDDPAKMIADFYLQPAIPVPYTYREAFFETVHQFLGEDVALVKRLPSVYILLALKWCLIMLNVFLWQESKAEFNEEVCISQLKKAREKLKKARHEFEAKAFPLSLS
jgi:thiamine kinase-like enzyme